jgi:hypothetical protein
MEDTKTLPAARITTALHVLSRVTASPQEQHIIYEEEPAPLEKGHPRSAMDDLTRR